ncbi:MAG: molecular chaperone DnaJ [Coriobacteriia bacterium]|nr:molecular chaperone DnaJ [Coriobacteriia bacterium]
MADKDLYEILGVDKDASDGDIKKAFRKKARTLHPDVNKEADAEERFKELNEAYDVLSDPNKRAQYDRFGTVGGAGGAGGYVDLEDLFGGGFGMGDLFSSFFGGGAGGGGRGPARREGRDMQVGLRITLEEAASGVRKEIVYDRLSPCDECGGSGLAEDGKEVTCDECKGQGRVVTVQQTFLGAMQSASTCTKCGGTGKTVENPCPECEGQGRVPDRQRLAVEIPAGIRNGQTLRMRDFGEAGVRGAESGDLQVTVQVKEHDLFERDGDDLHCSAVIGMVQAALGATIEVDGILADEKVKVEIPEGCQYGQVVRVKGFGMPRLRQESRGDLYVHVDVKIPERLSKSEREILEKLAEEMGESISERKSPLQKLKDAFN